ncbi:FAD-binding oxidoreductase [Gordonia sp. ABSL49_1]|uniref:FAD-binding oxidoreductase n=1 Tax=Gordonia sp. ABSL49_1 TaxID=2920941 RepID=UPI001F0DAF21|nr:FAD-binding oxidoreductase [Gordonia sp. ABSL49_1]MCH5644555.1 FAD-binding oxidoreductase [Gordonia sp. ABSL49_1]
MSDETATDETDLATVRMHRPRWGDPDNPGHLPDAAQALTAGGSTDRGVDPDHIPVPESTIPDAARTALTELLGADHVVVDTGERVQHTRGFSTPDLLRLRAGDVSAAPDVVVFPGSHDEVLGILALCTDHRLAAVPFTGGTSVVGGLEPERSGLDGVVCIDLRRMNRLVEVDEISRTATFEAGIRGTDAEMGLRERGFTLGHFPQSYEGAGIGGYAATRSAGQSSAGYGRFDEMVEGLVLATPRGTIELGTAPKSAAGPDLRQLVLGSEGVLGVITRVRLRIHPLPAVRVFEGWRFASFDDGARALRRLAQDGPLPTVLRLSDEVETALNLADPDRLGGESSGCLAITGFEGGPDDVRWRRAAAAALLTDCGATPLGTEPGESWRTGRFRAPYLRDPLLDAGVLVETLETVTFWSGLADLKASVTGALTDALTASGTPPLVMCHISHVYHSGASLYFTVVAPFGEDPLADWAAAKSAANAAIRAAGASITHHHAVGRDHRAAYHDEIGALGVELLNAAKRVVDPAGVCNPGILL